MSVSVGFAAPAAAPAGRGERGRPEGGTASATAGAAVFAAAAQSAAVETTADTDPAAASCAAPFLLREAAFPAETTAADEPPGETDSTGTAGNSPAGKSDAGAEDGTDGQSPPVQGITGWYLAALPDLPGDRSGPANDTLTADTDLPGGKKTGEAAAAANNSAAPVPVPVPVSAAAPVPAAPLAAVGAVFSAATAAAPAQAAHPAQAVQLLNQVSQPLLRLAAAAPGEHMMTLSVDPENLGPLTVRAHISSDGVRVEIFAPNETGREALRHLLADLRRDLAGSGTGGTATLTLSDHNQPGHGSGGSLPDPRDPGARQQAAAPAGQPPPAEAALRSLDTATRRPAFIPALPALDVMA